MTLLLDFHPMRIGKNYLAGNCDPILDNNYIHVLYIHGVERIIYQYYKDLCENIFTCAIKITIERIRNLNLKGKFEVSNFNSLPYATRANTCDPCSYEGCDCNWTPDPYENENNCLGNQTSMPTYKPTINNTCIDNSCRDINPNQSTNDDDGNNNNNFCLKKLCYLLIFKRNLSGLLNCININGY